MSINNKKINIILNYFYYLLYDLELLSELLYDLLLELLLFKLLNTTLKSIKKEEFPVTLEADSDVKNGTIVQIFDIIRKNGYASVNLRTAEKKR